MHTSVTTTDPSQRTRSFARVLGPFLAVVPAIVAIRAGSIDDQLSSFSADPMWPWTLGPCYSAVACSSLRSTSIGAGSPL